MQDKKIIAEPISHWSEVPAKNTSNFNLKRVKHSGIFYKGILYVYGGICLQSDLDKKNIYKYDFIVNQWQQIKTNIPSSLINLPIHSHAATLYGNNLYIFGGVNSQGSCTNEFVYLNLDTNCWRKIQQKGQLIPSPRKSANLLTFKSNIMLYGGRNQSNTFNDFFFYRFDSKSWFQADLQTYQLSLGTRSHPGICINKDLIYIFGGEAESSGGRAGTQMTDISSCNFLNDFYQIEVVFRETVVKPEIKVKDIITSNYPKPRSGHALTSLFNQKYLVLLGGYESDGEQIKDCGNNIWVYNIQGVYWNSLQATGINFSRVIFSCMEYDSTVYTFGGVNSQGLYEDSILKLSINFKIISNEDQLNNQNLCQICDSYKQQFPKSRTQIPYELIQAATNSIQFPFAAFGLLVDNSLLMNAQTCNIIYQNSLRQKYCLIEDNGNNKLWQNNNEFIQAMTTFDGVLVSDFINLKLDQQLHEKQINENQKKEKRVHRSIEEKIQQQKKKYYGINLKIAALKLDEKTKRVVLYRKEQINSKIVYACYYYILQDGKYIDSSMYQCRKIIDDDYKTYIRLANQRKWPMNNTIFILNDQSTQNIETEQQQKVNFEQDKLTLDYNLNDVIYGNRQIISKLQNTGISIYQCCDVSLRSYLSLLYLKNDNFSISLGVRDTKLQQIPTQMFLDKIDKLVKNKHIVELDGLIDLSQQIVEIYYNPNLSKKLNTFHNGVLIYHQNRLISRYKYPLGTLLLHRYKFSNKIYNILPIFGYIQLPSSFSVNNFKTKFTMDSLLQNIQSRIKLAERSFNRRCLKLNEVKNKKRQSQQECIKNQQDIAESLPKKSVKLNESNQ